MSLLQFEADDLLKMPKRFVTTDVLDMIQNSNGEFERKLISENKREQFYLNYGRYGRDSLILKYQTRGREVVILARLDITGTPHRNPPTDDYPDGRLIQGPHIHLYKEGFDDKFAFPVNEVQDLKLQDINNGVEILEDFLEFCVVKNLPPIQVVL